MSSTRSSYAAAAAAAVGLLSLPAFVPSSGPAAGSQASALPSLRGAAPSSAGAGAATYAVAAVATAAVGSAALRKARTSQKALRRDLAIAYEDSGIDLLDNGKFAQGLPGADGAWGRYEFDPVGFSRNTETVPWLREAELKHGRIAMLAWTGLVAPDFFRIPGARYSFDSVPVSIDAHDAFNGETGVDVQILIWISILELCCAKKVFEWNSAEVAGDYGLTNLFPKDEEGQMRMRTAELKNGRLAMVAFGGAITQAVITRHPFPWLY
eukprot:CAMPEP_0197620116 /NCGR_PEP_ID=MMETSP1338-20131121/985_1 /TAXON_ID=43686 ORGANISM="Pelagodinium beii, Strain RCC1491" /NCGR_SAMPLE_ID=MMETSP1338 /ASSEMBLY_ACC=CAM_ASM_000754 /LENGTH=266 /DNA_ID=CAMNT_0043189203 /DNA_START=42 /DNA_END=842 /DNA_ORIENTATION=+